MSEWKVTALILGIAITVSTILAYISQQGEIDYAQYGVVDAYKKAQLATFEIKVASEDNKITRGEYSVITDAAEIQIKNGYKNSLFKK